MVSEIVEQVFPTIDRANPFISNDDWDFPPVTRLFFEQAGEVGDIESFAEAYALSVKKNFKVDVDPFADVDNVGDEEPLIEAKGQPPDDDDKKEDRIEDYDKHSLLQLTTSNPDYFKVALESKRPTPADQYLGVPQLKHSQTVKLPSSYKVFGNTNSIYFRVVVPTARDIEDLKKKEGLIYLEDNTIARNNRRVNREFDDKLVLPTDYLMCVEVQSDRKSRYYFRGVRTYRAVRFPIELNDALKLLEFLHKLPVALKPYTRTIKYEVIKPERDLVFSGEKVLLKSASRLTMGSWRIEDRTHLISVLGKVLKSIKDKEDYFNATWQLISRNIEAQALERFLNIMRIQTIEEIREPGPTIIPRVAHHRLDALPLVLAQLARVYTNSWTTKLPDVSISASANVKNGRVWGAERDQLQALPIGPVHNGLRAVTILNELLLQPRLLPLLEGEFTLWNINFIAQLSRENTIPDTIHSPELEALLVTSTLTHRPLWWHLAESTLLSFLGYLQNEILENKGLEHKSSHSWSLKLRAFAFVFHLRTCVVMPTDQSWPSNTQYLAAVFLAIILFVPVFGPPLCLFLPPSAKNAFNSSLKLINTYIPDFCDLVDMKNYQTTPSKHLHQVSYIITHYVRVLQLDCLTLGDMLQTRKDINSQAFQWMTRVILDEFRKLPIDVNTIDVWANLHERELYRRQGLFIHNKQKYSNMVWSQKLPEPMVDAARQAVTGCDTCGHNVVVS